jgi:penicillin amidase
MFKKISESSPILSRFFVFIFAPVGIAAAASYFYLNQSVAPDSGAVALAGIGADVRIARGADAVPHISAASDDDAYFALGYVHAQDRLWQMEYQKLIGQGRLSELRGASTLPLDFYLRTLGLRQAAEQALTQLAPRSRQLLDAYVKGVNARIGEAKALPPEFYLNDRRPELWSAADSMLQLKLLQIGLNDSNVDMLRQKAMLRQFGVSRASELSLADVDRGIEVADANPANGDMLQELARSARRLRDEFGIGEGDLESSAWVVDGKLTSSGKPMLANDLHSVTQIPSKWYMSNLRGKQVHLAGASIPGLPIIFSGRNAHISWGTTSLRSLGNNLVEEKLDVLDDGKYFADGIWKQVATRVELINVKSPFPSYLRGDIKPIRRVVRSTGRGPIVSDLVESSGSTYALDLVGLHADDKSFDALLALNFAADWEQVKLGMRHYASPAMNIVYADRAGNIASKIVGKLAHGTRVEGVNLPPAPAGSTGVSYIAFDTLPETLNPADGIILRANYTPGHQLASVAVSRAARMERLLRDKTAGAAKVDVDTLLAIQDDELSVGAAAALKQMLTVKAQDARQEQALAYLRAWDFRATPNSVAASIYNVWIDHLFQTLVRENMANAAAARKIMAGYPPAARARFISAVLQEKQGAWCATGGVQAGHCGERMARSLEGALDELQLSVGSDMEDWQWGAIHTVAYRHPGIESESFFASLFNRSSAGRGDNFSVGGGSPAVFSKDAGYQRLAGSSYRQVMDLSANSKSKFITSTGQSGNIMSANYDNFMVAGGTAPLSNVGFDAAPPGAQVLTLTTLSSKSE